MNKRLALAPAGAAVLLALAGCASEAPEDPIVACIDVNVEYGLAADREEAGDFCAWLQDHETLLGGATFDETFSDPQLAKEWAEAELSKK